MSWGTWRGSRVGRFARHIEPSGATLHADPMPAPGRAGRFCAPLAVEQLMSRRSLASMLHVLVVVVARGQAAPASALRVTGQATGSVNDFHIDVGGEGAGVFGLDAAALLGHAVRLDFSYDTSLAPADANPAEMRGRFESGAADRTRPGSRCRS